MLSITVSYDLKRISCEQYGIPINRGMLQQQSPRFGVQFWQQFKIGHIPFQHVNIKYFLTPKPMTPENVEEKGIKALKKASLKHELFITKDEPLKELYVNHGSLYLSEWFLDVEENGLLAHKFVKFSQISNRLDIAWTPFERKSYNQRILYALHDSAMTDENELLDLPVVGFHSYFQSKNE